MSVDGARNFYAASARQRYSRGAQRDCRLTLHCRRCDPRVVHVAMKRLIRLHYQILQIGGERGGHQLPGKRRSTAI